MPPFHPAAWLLSQRPKAWLVRIGVTSRNTGNCGRDVALSRTSAVMSSSQAKPNMVFLPGALRSRQRDRNASDSCSVYGIATLLESVCIVWRVVFLQPGMWQSRLP